MKEMKRLVSMVLCLVMILSLLPVGAVRAHATETIVTGNVVDAAVVFSDLHVRSNDSIDNTTNRYKNAASKLTGILSAMKTTSGLTFSSVTSAGDAFAVNNDTDSVSGGNGKFVGYTGALTEYIQSVLGDVSVNYVWSDHDRYAVQEDGKTALSKDSGFVYGVGDKDANYYIFLLSMADTTTKERYNVTPRSESEVAESIKAFKATAATLDKSKPLFVVAHQPLLDRRDDNGYAYKWWEAIDAVAAEMDVAYFFGHNHNYDKSSDYYYAKGSTMSVCSSSNGSAKSVEMKFPHVCVGYMDPTSYSSTGTRRGVAVAVTIYENALNFKTYNNAGIYTGSYALDETVNRDHKLTSISVKAPEKVEYALGEELNLTGMTVTATYGSTKQVAVTEGYTLSDVDMTVAGEQTVTVTFGGKTASFTINVIAPEVADPTLVSIAITQMPKTEYAWGEDLDLTGMEVTATFSDGSTRVVEGWSVEEANMFESGTKVLGVYYSVGEIGAWAELEIVVGKAPTETPTEAPTEEPTEDSTEPEIKETTFFSEDTFAAVTATATGATLADVEENAKADELLEYWYGYDISLEGQVADTSVTVKLWLDPDAMTSENLAVYHVNENGELEAVTGFAVAKDEYDVEYITISNAALGTYIYGTPKAVESEGAKLVSLKLTPPTKTAYFDSDVKDKPVMVIAENGEQEETVEKVIYLDITGLEVIAVYDDGTEKEIQWNQFDESADGFALTFDALVVDGQVQYGKKTVTVTYVDGNETATATFTVNVCRESITVEEVTIKFDTPSVESLTVEIPETVDEVIADAVMEVIDGDVTVYDIKPVYAEGFDKLEGTATVTLPLPEGLTNPVVYYVSDDGTTIEKMDAQVVDGKLVFTTDHFSKYVVGNGTVGVENENQTVTKDLYILVDKIDEEGDYLLVNTNAAAANAVLLKANSNGVGTVTGVQIKSGLRADTNEGITYIEAPDASAIWAADGESGTYTLYNANTQRYLSINNPTKNRASLAISTSGATWTTSTTNAVYYNNYTGADRYIRYDNGWKLNGNSGTVYIYKLVEDVPVTETKYGGTYRIVGAANPATNVPALTGQTVALSNTVYFKSNLSGSTEVVQTPVANGTITYTFVDESGNQITENTIGTISGNTLTLNGTVGTGIIRVTYSWTENGENYQLYHDFTVTTKAPVYHVTLKKGNTTVTGDITASFVADGDPVGLTAELGADLANVVPANIQPTWTLEMTEGEAAIIDINDLTYTGESGTANLTCTYTWTDANGVVQTISETVTVTTTGERTELKIVQVKDGVLGADELKTLAVKGVNDSTNRTVAAVVTEYTLENPNGAAVSNPVVTWEVESDASAILDKLDAEKGTAPFTVDAETGYVTLNFSGNGGMATIRATLEDGTTKVFTINAAKSTYYTPEDGTNDFPDYPYPGAVVIDKTATPVGDFNKTGTALIELNMFGVPVTKGVDVVVVLDTSSSMKKDANGNDLSYDNEKSRYAIMKASLEEMLKTFDGGNVDLAIIDFNGYGSNVIPNTSLSGSGRTNTNHAKVFTGVTTAQTIMTDLGGVSGLGANHFENTGADAFNNTRISQILANFTGGQSGTNYDFAFDAAYELLKDKKAANEAKGEVRDQYVIFMSDGAPFRYNGFTTANNAGRSLMDKLLTGGYADAADLQKSFTRMADDVAAMYNGMDDPADSTNRIHPHRMAEAIKGNPNDTYYVVDSTNSTPYLKEKQGLGAKIYSIGFCIADDDYNDTDGGKVLQATSEEVIKNLSSGEGYYWENVQTKETLSGVFVDIAGQIKAAASDVAVNDLIAPSYSMTFEFPEGIDTAGVDEEHEFFIEVVNYKLDEQHHRTGESDSLIRVYMNTDGTFYARTATDGVKGDTDIALTFKAAEEGQKGYFTSAGVYVPDGTGTHNVATGVYYSGSIDGGDLVLITPYFTYLADGQQLDWITNELAQTSQIAIRYFVYLNGSADKVSGDASVEGQLPPGVYQTNTKATVTYTNHLGNECMKTFPVPQLTWSGAQVGVSFYLVNAQGQPINRSGEVVPLAAATFVTKTFYESVIWNTEKTDPLRASFLAKEYLPEEYSLYDENASYMIHVYKDEDGNIYDDFFEIGGTETVKTTYVYNTVNGIKYNNYGVYSGTIAQGKQVTYQEKQEDGSYVNKNKAVDYNTGTTIDYSSTNVAFAVVWIPTLAEDTVVVDFGLPVAINVTQNDQLDNTVNDIGTRITSNEYAMNTGVSNKSLIGLAEGSSRNGNTLILADGNRVTMYNGILYFTQGDMIFDDPSVFYYDSKVSYTNANNIHVEGYMYSRVTVVPATTIYYEDSYVDLSSTVIIYDEITLAEDYDDSVNYYKLNTDGTYERVNKRYLTVGEKYYTRSEGPNTDSAGKIVTGWEDAGEKLQNIVQGTDRPGDDKFHLTGYDADNIYGFDGAYDEYSKYSLGSAAKFTATPYKTGLATFEFYGTGFDVISVTSCNTGRLAVTVSKWVEGTGYERVKSYIVDTYYGYEYALCEVTYEFDGKEWVRSVGEKAADGATQTNPTFPTNPEKGVTVTVNEYALIVDEAAEANDLYQIPVMKVAGLAYGKYKVDLQVSYSEMFDHKTTTEPSYDFYLDAIRIYDPAGKTLDELDDKTEEVYNKDGELLPEYHELRNWILDANSYKTAGTDESVTVDGAVFIDGNAQNMNVGDYKNFGPNNEVYLAKKQSVAFMPNAIKPKNAKGEYIEGNFNANVHIAFKAVNGGAKVKISYLDGTSMVTFLEQDVKTATDLYFDITELNGKTVLIQSTGEAILSVTNIKYAYQKATTTTALESDSGSGDAPFSTNKADIDAVLSYLNMFIGEMSEQAEVEVTYEDEVAETEPEATEPEATEAEVEEPEATEPEATEAEVEEPEATEPEATEAEVEEPEATEPEATEAEVAEAEDAEEPESETIKLLPESQMESAEAKTTATTPLQKIINNFTKVWSDIVTFFKNLF